MILVNPIVIEEENLISSSILVDDAPVYSSGQAYNTGDTVIVANEVFEALTATSDEPNAGILKEPATWLRLGYVNKYRMFRDGTDSYTESPLPTLETDSEVIDVTVTPGQLVNTVALFTVDAFSVRVVMEAPIEGVVYDNTLNLVDYYVDNVYDFFFTPYKTRADIRFYDLPPYPEATIRVIITGNPGAKTKCGILTMGKAESLGNAQYGSSVGELNFDINERDGFGNLYWKPRRKVKRAEFDLLVESIRIDHIQKVLGNLTTPAAFLGSEHYDSTAIYGKYIDYEIIIESNELSDATMTVVGV